MKDPAFLFYPGDWMGGTQWMTFEQKGCYMELLILQFNCGEFTEAQAKQVLSICFDVAWSTLKQKFINEGEIYYNERLRIEIDKRKKFSESRRINGLGNKTPIEKSKAHAKHMPKHMEDENTIENIILLFNKKCIDFPKVLKCTKIREKKIILRLAEMKNDLGIIEHIFDKMQASDFLKGKNNNQWSATFDWLFENEGNWIKVVEGNYDNKKPCLSQKPEKMDYVTYNAKMAAELIEEIKNENKANDGVFTNPY